MITEQILGEQCTNNNNDTTIAAFISISNHSLIEIVTDITIICWKRTVSQRISFDLPLP